jgi:spore maturation protein CgeB
LIVNIAMDDRHQYWGCKVNGKWGGTYGLIPHIDLALTAAPECVDWYLKEACPAIFFPEASDPEIFHPMPALAKIHDISFVGRRYGIREKIVFALRSAGIQVSAYGDGWENGFLKIEKVPRLFAQSRIILGIGTIGHCADFYALKMRDFDGPMSGSCYVTHDNADLRQLYDVGKEIVTYRTLDECVEKVSFYLKHETECEKIAQAGRRRAMIEHTWDKRFDDMVNLFRSDAINSIAHNFKSPLLEGL